ncbi:MAG: alpha/beta hydrolase [Peptoniphilaceae bacterium]|nr:alpha/beta hydrolase [Peptoniphilaceae bacterium]MDY3737568.1 alpha/beta hydrolase [Peptoniphilaceae bacterium]
MKKIKKHSNKKYFLALSMSIFLLSSAIGNKFVDETLSRKKNKKINGKSVAPKDNVDEKNLKIINETNRKYKEIKEVVFNDENIKKEEVSVKTKDNINLFSTVYTQNTKRKHDWVIFVHGYASSRNSNTSKNIVSIYLKNGFQVVSVDNRGHGKSGGNYITMGYKDKDDIKLWVKYIKERDKNSKIALHGISMGASTVMMASGDIKDVYAIVEDCGYTSVWDEMKSELKYHYNLPAFPALYIANITAKIRAKTDFKKASSINSLNKTNIPMLFIHGDKDNFVPFEMLEKNYNAHNGKKEKLIIKGAGHAQSYLLEPEKYWKKVFDFLDKYKN